MIASIVALYCKSPTTVAYMLQSAEYQVGAYLRWYWRTQDFSKVMHRRTLDRTRRAKTIVWALRLGMIVQAVLGLAAIAYVLSSSGSTEWALFGAALLLSYPVIWAHLIALPILLADLLVVRPERRRLMTAGRRIFAEHPAVKIAVAGSYGKTTMKELLLTVLADGKKVAATPANKNVIISQAAFARSLDGTEEVLVVEFGEGAPGDVAAMTSLVQPDHAFITGLAPAHLDAYKTLQAAGEDIFTVAEATGLERVYVNGDSAETEPFIKKGFNVYRQSGLGDWQVHDIQVSLQGTAFSLQKGKTKLALQTGLLGRHQIGPLVAVVDLALQLGLTPAQIVSGIAKTMPFSHRMQPAQRAGAWIIDDTYNGNLEGIRAGTALLREIEAKRKWYVTPGLVEQGAETQAIHRQAGKLIADAQPDVVVLMQNSVTEALSKGLRDGNYQGELRIETDPLDFYANLEHFVVHGDVVLVQNDWTDNYA